MAVCQECTAEFEITDKDRDFYIRMNISEPKCCPDCRMQKRLAFRNQNYLYHRKCDFSGEDMISLYKPGTNLKVYKEEIYWGDDWDPMDYGQDFDFSRPFFEQYEELLRNVPRRAMHQDGSNENADYATYGMGNKNSYLLFGCFYSEDSYYSWWIGFVKDTMDCFRCTGSQILYESNDCDKCYECFYCSDCISCQSSYLLDDCRNCKDCIACKNLRNKELHIYNKPVSKEEFESFKAKMLDEGIEKERDRFNKWKLQLPYLYARIRNSENCTGDYIENARNCHECFDMVFGAEDCKYCQVSGWQGKDMMDCSMAGKESDLCCEIHGSVNVNNGAFCNAVKQGSDVYYCDSVHNIKNCFGCIALRHKEHCILNKQYSPEKYEEMKAKIIEHMKKTGEWGEFFPITISPFAYNESFACEYFPMTKDEVLARGWEWKEKDNREYMPATYSVPDKIEDVPDSITKEVLACEECGKNYNVIPQELRFYKKYRLKVPKLCYLCRHNRRITLRNPYKLWSRECSNCKAKIRTSYSPERPEKVYCEQCYLAEVY